jgi:hypothetical protein
MSEGSVFRRADGKWCAKWKDATGTWRYLYRKSKAEAKKALRQALKDRDEGIIPPTKTTVGVLLDEWHSDACTLLLGSHISPLPRLMSSHVLDLTYSLGQTLCGGFLNNLNPCPSVAP